MVKSPLPSLRKRCIYNIQNIVSVVGLGVFDGGIANNGEGNNCGGRLPGGQCHTIAQPDE